MLTGRSFAPRGWAHGGSLDYRANHEHSEATMQTVVELRAGEQEVEREWQWLQNTLNTTAGAKAEQGDAAEFRLMQAQADGDLSALRSLHRRVTRLRLEELEEALR